MRRKTALIIAVMHAKQVVVKVKAEKELMLKRDSNRQPPLRCRCSALSSKMCYEASWELVTF